MLCSHSNPCLFRTQQRIPVLSLSSMPSGSLQPTAYPWKPSPDNPHLQRRHGSKDAGRGQAGATLRYRWPGLSSGPQGSLGRVASPRDYPPWGGQTQADASRLSRPRCALGGAPSSHTMARLCGSSTRPLCSLLAALCLFQIALEDAHMVQGVIAAIRPKVARSKANVIGRLHWGLHAVPGRIREGVQR